MVIKDRSSPLHPGPFRTMAVNGGFAAAIFALGSVVFLLIGLREARWFILLTIPAALVFALLMHRAHKRPVEEAQLSITDPSKQ